MIVGLGFLVLADTPSSDSFSFALLLEEKQPGGKFLGKPLNC